MDNKTQRTGPIYSTPLFYNGFISGIDFSLQWNENLSSQLLHINYLFDTRQPSHHYFLWGNNSSLLNVILNQHSTQQCLDFAALIYGKFYLLQSDEQLMKCHNLTLLLMLYSHVFVDINFIYSASPVAVNFTLMFIIMLYWSEHCALCWRLICSYHRIYNFKNKEFYKW